MSRRDSAHPVARRASIVCDARRRRPGAAGRGRGVLPVPGVWISGAGGATRPVAPGIGYVAVRSGASIVSIVIGGNDLLYLGRRITVRVQPAVTWQALAAVDGDSLRGATPVTGSVEEQQLAHRVADGLRAHVAGAVRQGHEDVAPRPGARLRGTRLTHLFR